MLGNLEGELQSELAGEDGEFLQDILPLLQGVARRVQPAAVGGEL